MTLTPYEAGYKAFLDGKSRSDNPHAGDVSPHSLKRWLDGFDAAQLHKSMRAYT